MLENFLKKLQDDFGFNYQKKEDRVFSLSYGDNNVTIKDLDPGLSLATAIASTPEKRDELFPYLMKANLLNEGTGISSIGLSEDEKSLTLSTSMPYEVNYKEFKEILEEFLNYLNYWKKEISEFEQEAT